MRRHSIDQLIPKAQGACFKEHSSQIKLEIVKGILNFQICADYFKIC